METTTQVHVCPRCSLRFVHRSELHEHLRHEHALDLRPPSDVVTVVDETAGAGLAEAPWGTIAVPVDPTREPVLAVDVAMAVAHQAAMAVELVAVPPPGLPLVTTELFLASRTRSTTRGAHLPPRSWQVLEPGDVAGAIVQHAKDGGTELVCMASRSRGAVGEMMLGSVSEAVVRRSPVPVLLVGPYVRQVPERYGRLVVALDGSPQAARALRAAAALDGHLRAGLFLVEVLGVNDLPDDVDVPETATLQHAARELDEPPVGFDVLHGADVARTLVDFVDEWDDRILVLGTHGRSGLNRLVMGSVALEVVRQAPCPVLVVPPAATLGK